MQVMLRTYNQCEAECHFAAHVFGVEGELASMRQEEKQGIFKSCVSAIHVYVAGNAGKYVTITYSDQSLL
jgi:hypothetical protein